MAAQLGQRPASRHSLLPATEHLQDLLLEGPEFDELLLEPTAFPASEPAAPEVKQGAISEEHGGRSVTVSPASSGNTARRTNNKQSVSKGPSRTALRVRQAALMGYLRTNQRWHRCRRAIADGCMMPVPARPGRQGILMGTLAQHIPEPMRDLDHTP